MNLHGPIPSGMTVAQAAKAWRVSRVTVYQWIRKRRIRAVQRGVPGFDAPIVLRQTPPPKLSAGGRR